MCFYTKDEIMKDLSEQYEIARLIAARIAETITPEELERLEAWLAEDVRHRERFLHIQERLRMEEKDNAFRKPEGVLKDWEQVKRKLPGKRTALWGKRYLLRYVAVIFLVVGVAATWMWKPWEKQQAELPQLVRQETVVPGSSKAILTLANGEKVSLEEVAVDSLEKDGVLIRKGGGELAYEKSSGNCNRRKCF